MLLAAFRRPCINSASYEYKNKSASNRAQECQLFADVSVHQILIFQHLRQSILLCIRVDLNKACIYIAKGNITVSNDFHSCERNTDK